MQPSSWHGVTTVVMGNCGVGFAPCRPSDHDRLIRLMEGVEDIPFPVLAEGLPWNWESYPDYLDALARRAFDVDIGSQLPHAALRVFVMGERGANREPATAEDIAAMAAIATEAMRGRRAGLFHLAHPQPPHQRRPADADPHRRRGRTDRHRAGPGGGRRRACCRWSPTSPIRSAEFAMLRRIVEASGRPLSFTLAQSPLDAGRLAHLLRELDEAVAAGLPMKAQVGAARRSACCWAWS